MGDVANTKEENRADQLSAVAGAEEKDNASFPEPGDIFYIVPTAWMDAWKSWAKGDSDETPGPIDLAPLGAFPAQHLGLHGGTLSGKPPPAGSVPEVASNVSGDVASNGDGGVSAPAPASASSAPSAPSAPSAASDSADSAPWPPLFGITLVPRTRAERTDFQLVSRSAYGLLKRWHGCRGAEAPRAAIETAAGTASVEVHLPYAEVTIASTGGLSLALERAAKHIASKTERELLDEIDTQAAKQPARARIAFVTRKIAVGDAVAAACRAVGVASDLLYYRFYDPVTGESFGDDRGRTLEELSIDKAVRLILAPKYSTPAAAAGVTTAVGGGAPATSTTSTTVSTGHAGRSKDKRSTRIDRDLADDDDDDDDSSDSSDMKVNLLSAGIRAGRDTTSNGSDQQTSNVKVAVPSSSSSSSSSSTSSSSSSSSSSSIGSTASVVGSGAVAKPRPATGITGLTNLGNTCFMNSALQCLVSVPPLTRYLRGDGHVGDLNTTNPLGCGGKVAMEYAKLVKAMYSASARPPQSHGYSNYSYGGLRDSSAVVSPRDFRYVIAQFAPRFTGYDQHDSQEFLSFLLDGLHEDLNRIVKKEPTEPVEAKDGESDAEVAERAWRVHKVRNDSIVVDKFQGQYKSRLECPHCGRVSVTFDPFMYLSVELPSQRVKLLPVVYHPLHGGAQAVTYIVRVPRVEPTVGCVLESLSGHVGRDASHLAAAVVYKGVVDVVPCHSRQLDGLVRTGDELHVYAVRHEVAVTKGKGGKNGAQASSYTPYTSYAYQAPSLGANVGEEVARAEVPVYFVEEEAEQTKDTAQQTPAYGTGGAYTSQPSNYYYGGGQSIAQKKPIGPPLMVQLDAGEAGVLTQAAAVKGVEQFVSMVLGSGGPSPSSSPALSVDPKEAGDGDDKMDTDGDSPSSKRSEPSGPSVPMGEEDNGLENTAQSTNNAANSDASNPNGPTNPNGNGNTNDDEKRRKTGMDDSTPGGGNGVDSGKGTPVSPRVDVALLDSFKRCNGASSPIDRDSAEPIRGLSNGRGFLVTLPPSMAAVLRKRTCVTEDAESNSVKEAHERRKREGATLEECLDLFSEEELLTEDNLWYCSGCKEHVAARKKMALWRAPEVLVVHLKRFSHGRYGSRQKVAMPVRFPVEGLDLSHRLAVEDKDAVYDLVGVSNHMGGYGGGHYTAFAIRNGAWHKFDDSWTSPMEASRVQSEDAYVLFYVRRSALAAPGSPRNETSKE